MQHKIQFELGLCSGRIMDINLEIYLDYFGFEGFEGTGLELFKHSLDAKNRSLLNNLCMVFGIVIIGLSWICLCFLIFLAVMIVFAYLIVNVIIPQSGIVSRALLF